MGAHPVKKYMSSSKPTTIEEYIAAFSEETQEVLYEVRSTIRKAAPEAGEKISYDIPTFTLNGTYLIYFAGYKKHISVYPIPHGNESLIQEIAPYKKGKGTLQFPLDKPIPLDLISRVTKQMVKENKERSGKRK